MLFEPEEYRDLSPAERDMLRTAYDRALDAIRRNITPKGFSACSLADNESYGADVNYRSVWARDGAMTAIWTLDIDEPDVRACQRQTLATLLAHQSPTGQIPSSVRIDRDHRQSTPRRVRWAKRCESIRRLLREGALPTPLFSGTLV
jgi:hypothetical protein